MKCSYCHQEKGDDGMACVVCGVYVCWDCMLGDALMFVIVV
jgi:hypothetical protein